MKISQISDIGQRERQQDIIYQNLETQTFAVCDGHGEDGHIAAADVCELINDCALMPESEKEILEKFSFINEQCQWAAHGTTCSVAFKIKDEFLIAILGDSPVFYRSEGKVYHLAGHGVSNWRNPDLKNLQEFIYDGRYVRAPKSFAMLAMTRAIGDRVFKERVGHVPDIYRVKADALALCSDGFMGGAEDVAKLFEKRKEAVDFLEFQRNRFGVSDNFSALVIYD